jgi:hypothetical protein
LADAAGIARRRQGPVDAPALSLQDHIAQTAGPVALPDWSPRMPVGIWCRASAVSVRNVTIEALK